MLLPDETHSVSTTVLPVTTVTDEITTGVVLGVVPLTTTIESDDDDLLDVVDEDDFRTMEDMIEPPIDVQSIRVGSRFRAAKDVQDMLAVFARKEMFKIRLEKNAIVCANAGQSNWTDICNYTARAQKSFRKIQKSQGEGASSVDDNVDANLQDILHVEQDKVPSQH
jgi:uncharacterized protein YqgV (UPF0045/DUF77 family)